MTELIVIMIVVGAAWAYVKYRHVEETGASEVAAEPVEQASDIAVEPVVADVVEPVESVEPVAVEIVAEVAEPVVASVKALKPAVIVVPEDSTLRRHYLQNLLADKPAFVSSMPEDSTLKRHYSQLLAAAADQSAVVSAVEQAAPVALASSDVVAASLPRIPEEAVLRRHFMQKLTADIEVDLPARPTDSALKRHFDAHLASLVQAKLAQLA